MTLLLPELILALSGFVFLLLGAFRGDSMTRLITYSSMAVCLIAGLAVILVGYGEAFSHTFIVDKFSVFVKVLILAAGFIVFVLSLSGSKISNMARPEYPVLILFGLLGGLIVTSARDFLVLYVGLELQGMVLYILSTFERDKASSVEAGIKYFILGSLASVFMLYGISLLYGVSGTTGYVHIVQGIQQALQTTGGDPKILLAKTGMAFLFAGIIFKVSIVPFHMWTIDVYENATTLTTTFFATIAKISTFAILTRLIVCFYASWKGAAWSWDMLFVVVAVASLLLGAFGGLVQTKLKQLIAYSSIMNMGLALLPLVIAGEKRFDSLAGESLIELGAANIQAVWIYLVFYVLSLLGVFGVLLSMRRQGVLVSQIQDLAGLGKTHPLLALCMSCFLFSLSGVPPLVGFLGKFLLFQNLVDGNVVKLAVVGLLASVVAAAYYLRLVKIMYFDLAGDRLLDPVPEKSLRFVVVGTGLLTLVLTIWPSSLIEAAYQAAESLRMT